MYVRRSNMEDIPAMMDLYAQARVFMRENGNPNQWDDSYPSRELLERILPLGTATLWKMMRRIWQQHLPL